MQQREYSVLVKASFDIQPRLVKVGCYGSQALIEKIAKRRYFSMFRKDFRGNGATENDIVVVECVEIGAP